MFFFLVLALFFSLPNYSKNDVPVVFSKDRELVDLLLPKEDFFPEEIKRLIAQDIPRSKAAPESLPEWTFLVYMEADNDLISFASKNLAAMTEAAGSPNFNLIIQMNRPKEKKLYRLKVESGKLYDVGSLSQYMGKDPETEVFDAVSWCSKSYPSKYFGLVFWNHGGGIIERSKQIWLNSFDSSATPVDAASRSEFEDLRKRGILYNDTFHSFLSTEAMTRLMQKIRVSLCRKLDFLGMDACLMAMMEIAFAIRDSVRVMVGSENVELGDGWNYKEILNQVSKCSGRLTPEELAKVVVSAYEAYYLQKDPKFSQSVVYLDRIDTLKDKLNEFVLEFLALRFTNKDIAQSIFESMFSSRYLISFGNDYVDICSFCDALNFAIAKYLNYGFKHFSSTSQHEIICRMINISQKLNAIKECVNGVVYSSSCGLNHPNIKGLTIYLPNVLKMVPNAHYFTSDFARNSLWTGFLSFDMSEKLFDL